MDRRKKKGKGKGPMSGQEFTQVIVPEFPPQFQHLQPIETQYSVKLSSLDDIETFINGKNCDDADVIYFRDSYVEYINIQNKNIILDFVKKTRRESAQMVARVMVCYCSLCYLSTREGARDLVPYILSFEDAWEDKKAPVDISKLKGSWCKQFFYETMLQVKHPVTDRDFKDLDELIQQLRSVGINFCMNNDFERAITIFAAAEYVWKFQPSESDDFQRVQKICGHFISHRKDVDLELIMPLLWYELKWAESPDPKGMNAKKDEWSRDFVDNSVKRFNKSVGAKLVKTDQLIGKLISIGDGFAKEGKYAEAEAIFVDAAYICLLFCPKHLNYVNDGIRSCSSAGMLQEKVEKGTTDKKSRKASSGANKGEQSGKSGPTTSSSQGGKQGDEVAFGANKGEEGEKSGPTTSSPQVGKLGDEVGAPPRAHAFLETNLDIPGMGMSVIKVKENEELYHGTVDLGGVSLEVSLITYTDLMTARRVYADLFNTLCHNLLKPQHCPFQASFLGVERAIIITPKVTTWELFLKNAYKKHECTKAVSPFGYDMGGLNYEEYVRMLRGIIVGLSCLLSERINFDAWSVRIYISNTNNIPLVLPWPCFESLHNEFKGNVKAKVLPKTVMINLSSAMNEVFKYGNPLGEEDRFYELKCLLDQLKVEKWRGRRCPLLILSNPCLWTMEERHNFVLKFRNFYDRSFDLQSHFELYKEDQEGSKWIDRVVQCDDEALKGVLVYTPKGKGKIVDRDTSSGVDEGGSSLGVDRGKSSGVDEGGSSLGDEGAKECKEWEYEQGVDVVRFVCNCFWHYNQHNKRVRLDELQILEIVMGIIPKMFMFLVRVLLEALAEERCLSDSFYEEIEGLFVDL